MRRAPLRGGSGATRSPSFTGEHGEHPPFDRSERLGQPMAGQGGYLSPPLWHETQGKISELKYPRGVWGADSPPGLAFLATSNFCFFRVQVTHTTPSPAL